jgi:hypothetical protein
MIARLLGSTVEADRREYVQEDGRARVGATCRVHRLFALRKAFFSRPI